MQKEVEKKQTSKNEANFRMWSTGILAMELALLVMGGIKHIADTRSYDDQMKRYNQNVADLRAKAGDDGKVPVHFAGFEHGDGQREAPPNDRLLYVEEAERVLFDKPEEPEDPFSNPYVFYLSYAIGAMVVLRKDKIDASYRKRLNEIDHDEQREKTLRTMIENQKTVSYVDRNGKAVAQEKPPYFVARQNLAELAEINHSWSRRIEKYYLTKIWPYSFHFA